MSFNFIVSLNWTISDFDINAINNIAGYLSFVKIVRMSDVYLSKLTMDISCGTSSGASINIHCMKQLVYILP